MAVVYVREDEDPYEMNSGIFEEKTKTFSSDLSFFFKSQPLKGLTGLQNITNENLKVMLQNSAMEMKQLKAQLDRYISNQGS